MLPRNIKKHTGSGFFARILAALLTVNIGTIGILIFVTYSQNKVSITKRTRENIHQQVSILAEKFREQYRNSLERNLRTLVSSPTLNDYLLGSEAEQLVIARRLEREYLRYLDDYPFLDSISFVDEDKKVAVSVKKRRRRSGKVQLSDLPESDLRHEWHQVLNLYNKLENIPILLFSGNMEWFMPPREARSLGPFINEEGQTGAAIGQSKLDTNTGAFGGVVIIEFSLDQWLEELKKVQFFNAAPIWLFGQNNSVLLKPTDADSEFDPRDFINEQVTSSIELLETNQGLIAYTDLPLGPITQFVRLAAGIPTELLLLDLNPVIDFFTAVLAVSIFLLVLISYSVSRYLAQPVAALQTTQNRLANAQRIARLGHWELEIDNQELIISDFAREILGINKDSDRISFDKFIECADPDDRQAVSDIIHEVIRTHRSGSIEHGVCHQDGPDIFVYQDIEIESGPETRVIGIIQDISLRKSAEERIKKLAFYDSITGLANRALLNQLATEAIELAESIEHRVAFLFLDLDHFKRINDTFGHDAGDELLRQVANRLRHCVRLNDTVGAVPEFERAEKTVARLGGDEFIILLTHLVHPKDVTVIAKRIKRHLARKFSIAGKDVFITGSLGISLYPDNGDNVDDLLRHADAAMYHAKNKGRNCYEFFTRSIEQDIQHRLSLETRLHHALERGDFLLHYQPRIDIQTNQIVAVEALVRWIDSNEGMIGPDQFIPVAEDTGLIIPIGEWVLKESCEQLAKWRQEIRTSVTLSINLSPVQFKAANLLDTVRNVLNECKIEPGWIEFELTENALFENIEASVQVANEFKALGVRLSIDDFGTGYSSLQQLRRFPVDTIKIDRSFIRDILDDADDALIVKSAISLGHNLRLRVVAEGVENEDQLAYLKLHQCDEIQGYLFGRPQSADEISHLLLQEAENCLNRENDAKYIRSA